MMYKNTLVAVSLSALALGSAIPVCEESVWDWFEVQLHEFLDNVPNGFSFDGTAESSTNLTLRIALAQSNFDGLVEALYNVSDPSSEYYGQYLSKEEVDSFVQPDSESVEAVTSWLSEYDLTATNLSSAGDILSVELTVGQANDLLSADYSLFTHEATGQQTLRTLNYSIPVDLANHVNFVHPTVTFPLFMNNTPIIEVHPASNQSQVRSAQKRDSACGTGTPWITPACLQELYDIPTTAAFSLLNQIAVTGYDNEYAQAADLESFLSEYRTDMSPNTTFSTVTLNGGENPQNKSDAGTEANLDVQYVMGLATNVSTTFISTGGDFAQALLDTADYLLGETSPPQVVSTSYGTDESSIGEMFALSLCNAYAQLGARGVSVLFASGDGGVSGNKDDGSCTAFVPTFPSGCPFVTSVGATINLPTEEGASFSSGGFSNYWPQPSYQASAVSAYLSALGSNDTGLYNVSGRAYPDVAAYGSQFEIYTGGALTIVSGTSCSTPTFAAVIALLNDELINAGKNALGFLNPWLYANSGALNDVATGNNLACSDGSTGFYAAAGWDPVTGLGTPNYSSLKSAAGL
ncbi:family S53 protease [Laetiporus sulphureus 93-53]|uniref:tripeptidyl-peptidase II n=1 Tax=Laetiporus sulphureus 93-53 TaxID=1314785 RepID=A0A165D1P4_9APHY|nr:family S53 protease [Laetiporus sulphureus 93-53]KZT03971.1 family S53 protease [Laetiporus sulphureus 93-53]